MVTVQQAFDLALQHHQAGRLLEAESLYRQILAVQPDAGAAMHYLGVLAYQRGHSSQALDWIQRAISLIPADPAAHANLGEVYRSLGQLDEAISAYRRAIYLDPSNPAAHSNLGEAYRLAGQLGEAVASCVRAVELRSNFTDAYNNLGNALRDQGKLSDAAAAYRSALKTNPEYPTALNNLGVVLAEMGHLDEAIAAYQRALQLKADYAEAQNNLGNALTGQGRFDQAILAYYRALALKPEYADALNNVGNALSERGRLDEAIAACRRALQLRPDHPGAWNTLGNALKDQGVLDEAIAAYRRGLQVQPDHVGIYSNLIYALHFQPGEQAKVLTDEQLAWNRQFVDPVRTFIVPHLNDLRVERRLRVGYVSPDFRNCVVGRNVMPLFVNHSHGDFELVCYSGVVCPDEMTEQFRRRTDQWRCTVGVADEALAETIREDRVDILIDLTQHMFGNRLTMFGYKAAPIQVSFAGYPDSTGMSAIDYRISDLYLESQAKPSDWQIGWKNESHRQSEHVFLIDSFWCYDPCAVNVEVNDLPAKQTGRINFGCLNNFCKINEPLLRLWARVLRQVPDSRLVMLSGFGSHRQRTIEFLERQGVVAERVEFVEPRPRKAYLELYHRLDVALDTLPYNGHTTSLDALWMGVPVVSLAGNSPVSRAGWSQLSNLGLPELVAHAEDEFVEIATRLARDLPRLAELRRTLRGRMEGSVLMDAPRFARNIEAAYRAMWRRWCTETTS